MFTTFDYSQSYPPTPPPLLATYLKSNTCYLCPMTSMTPLATSIRNGVARARQAPERIASSKQLDMSPSPGSTINTASDTLDTAAADRMASSKAMVLLIVLRRFTPAV